MIESGRGNRLVLIPGIPGAMGHIGLVTRPTAFAEVAGEFVDAHGSQAGRAPLNPAAAPLARSGAGGSGEWKARNE
jgi:hypothetical protein